VGVVRVGFRYSYHLPNKENEEVGTLFFPPDFWSELRFPSVLMRNRICLTIRLCRDENQALQLYCVPLGGFGGLSLTRLPQRDPRESKDEKSTILQKTDGDERGRERIAVHKKGYFLFMLDRQTQGAPHYPLSPTFREEGVSKIAGATIRFFCFPMELVVPISEMVFSPTRCGP